MWLTEFALSLCTFLLPLVVGARHLSAHPLSVAAAGTSLQRPRPERHEACNCVVFCVVTWFIELVDYLLVGHLLAWRETYVCLRIALSIWMARGGARWLYKNYLMSLVAAFGPVVDDTIATQVAAAQQEGFTAFLLARGRTLAELADNVLGSVKSRLSAPTVTPVSTPRRNR